MGGYLDREQALCLLVLSNWLMGFVATLSARADDAIASLTDRFADEPDRPKAEAPIHFLDSFDEARAEAERSHRRILAYFTGGYCGWCRVMEKRTLTDAEVVELSKGFVYSGGELAVYDIGGVPGHSSRRLRPVQPLRHGYARPLVHLVDRNGRPDVRLGSPGLRLHGL